MSENLLVTVITSVSSIVAILVGRWQIGKFVQRRRARRTANGVTAAEAAKREQAEAALADYEANPGSFVQLVLNDNAQKHEEIQSLRDAIGELAKAREADRREIDAIRTELDDLRRDDSRFRDALSRWLRDVFAAWGRAAVMPRPYGEDEIILRPVLPWAPPIIHDDRATHPGGSSASPEGTP